MKFFDVRRHAAHALGVDHAERRTALVRARPVDQVIEFVDGTTQEFFGRVRFEWVNHLVARSSREVARGTC